MINVGEGFESGSCGPTLIDGEEKRCPVVAECNAAGKALSLLEHIRSVEVVDFNYETLTSHRQKISSLIQLMNKHDSLFSSADSAWSSLIDTLESNTKDLRNHPIASTGSLATELEECLSQMKVIYNRSVSAIVYGN